MAEPSFVEGLSENEIEALAAWMLEKEAQSYYGGPTRALGGPAQLLGPTRVPETIKGAVSTQLRAMSPQQKRQKAAKALASIDTNTLADIAPGAYMFRRIIEQVSSLPSAQPEVPPELQEQWGPAGTPAARELGPSASALQFGPSAPTRWMGGEPKPWEVVGRTPPESSIYDNLIGLSGPALETAVREGLMDLARQNRLFARNPETGEIIPDQLGSEATGYLSYLQLFGSEGLGAPTGTGGGMTAYQSAQLGIQQQQLENERERIRQAMIGLGITGAGAMGNLQMQGSKLAGDLALYALPPGTQYMPGLEPGGPASRVYGGVGSQFTPVPAAGTMVNPYAGAEKAAPMIQEYLRQLGLGVTP